MRRCASRPRHTSGNFLVASVIVVALCVAQLWGTTPSVSAQTFPAYDTLETTGPDGTVVTTRVIAGITVTITTSGPALVAETYFTGPVGFTGAAGGVNAPLNPGQVSLNRFLTTVFGGGNGFNQAEPITFTFSSPVTLFGLTTLDILENAETSSNSVTLAGGAATDTKTAPQGGSGIDVDWQVSDPSGFTTVTLSASGALSQNGFGIDDLCLTPAGCLLVCPLGDGGIVGTTPGVRSPDINMDTFVNLQDLALFALCFAGSFDPCCDFNCDGLINIADLSILALHWLHSGPTPGMCQ